MTTSQEARDLERRLEKRLEEVESRLDGRFTKIETKLDEMYTYMVFARVGSKIMKVIWPIIYGVCGYKVTEWLSGRK